MRQVLVLRPEPGASATVERARGLGLDAISLPLFKVEPVEWEPPDPSAFDALLLTSANAVRHAGEGLAQLRGLQVYAVGEATARTARQTGLDVASIGEGGVERLFDAIDPTLRLLHLIGEQNIQANTRQEVTQMVVYRSRELEDPGKIPDGCVSLIHSPRAGRRLTELVGNRSTIAIAAISPRAAEAVGGGWECVEAAESPSDDALLALAALLCNKSSAG